MMAPVSDTDLVEATWDDARYGDYFVQGQRRGTIDGFSGPDGNRADEVSWRRDDGLLVWSKINEAPILLRRREVGTEPRKT